MLHSVFNELAIFFFFFCFSAPYSSLQYVECCVYLMDYKKSTAESFIEREDEEDKDEEDEQKMLFLCDFTTNTQIDSHFYLLEDTL